MTMRLQILQKDHKAKYQHIVEGEKGEGGQKNRIVVSEKQSTQSHIVVIKGQFATERNRPHVDPTPRLYPVPPDP